MNRVAIVVVSVLVVLAVGGGAFYGGMKFGQNQVIENPMEYLQGTVGLGGPFAAADGNVVVSGEFPRVRGTPGAGMPGFGRVVGGGFDTVQSVEGNVVTVSTQDGSTKQVFTTDTTLIQKYTTVGVEALEAGDQVIVSGTTNDDGSVTARSIRTVSGMQFDVQGEPAVQP